MKTISIKDIAAAVGGTANGDALITSVVIDNREVTKGSLFIAIKGERLDGHQFIESAVAAGAAAVMASSDVKTTVPVIHVEDTRKAFLDLACWYRQGFNIPVVGITGSVGKTTTKEMVWCVLNAKFNAHKTLGNWNNDIGVPKVLLGLEETHTAAVVEMGMNHKGEMSVLTKTSLPTLAVITNVGVSHIENLGSREGILAAKLEILDGLKSGSTLILSADNDMLSTVTEESLGNKYFIRRFGIENEADVKAEDIKFSDKGTTFTAVIKPTRADCLEGAGCEEIEPKKFAVKMPTIGLHSVLDALAAITVGVELGIEYEAIASALEKYEPTGLREKVEVVKGVTLLEDCYNASPDSVKALAASVKIRGEGKRKIAVIADMLELGDFSETAHRNCGRYLAEAGVDMLLTYGDNAKFVADEAKANGLLRVFEFDDKSELSSHLLGIIKEGDLVAFKGSRGMKLEDVIDNIKGELVK